MWFFNILLAFRTTLLNTYIHEHSFTKLFLIVKLFLVSIKKVTYIVIIGETIFYVRLINLKNFLIQEFDQKKCF